MTPGIMKPLPDWTDEDLGAALLQVLYRIQDAAGESHGRSYGNELLSLALGLLPASPPPGDYHYWPLESDMIAEARTRLYGTPGPLYLDLIGKRT